MTLVTGMGEMEQMEWMDWADRMVRKDGMDPLANLVIRTIIDEIVELTMLVVLMG